MNKRLFSLVLFVSLVATGSYFWLTREKLPLYLSVDTPPAPALSPAEALAGFTLAPGFSVELVAAEPLVVDPVAMTWDEAGRLFVVEMRGFMPNIDGEGEDQPVGRVVMLLDDDGDGTMDRSEIFLDGLVLPRAVTVVNEGLLVAEPPNLWLCPEIKDKARCENRRKVADYATDHEQVSMEHLENGLLLGLDNWIYNAKSERRFRFVEGNLKIEKTLARGQWGISQDDWGRLYYNTNSNFLSGDYFPAHSRSGVSVGLGEMLSEDDEVFSTRVNPGVNRAYVDGVLRDDGRLKKPTAVSGLAVYRGGQFPSEYWNNIFVPEPAANAIVQLRANLEDFEVKSEHITYPDKVWGQREFFTSTDERFRPVDLKVGPDGALYVIDMYRGIIQHKAFLTEELKAQIKQRGLDKPLGQGRIWRVVHSDSPRLKVPNLAESSTADKVSALSHPTPWMRETAQRLLGQDHSAQELLKATILESESHKAVIHSLWALEAQNALSAESVMTAIHRSLPGVAAQALYAGGHLLNLDQLQAVSENALRDTGSALVWLQSLERHNSEPVVQANLLRQLKTQSENVYRREASVRASRGVEMKILAQLLEPDLQNTASNRSVLKDLVSSAYASLIHGHIKSEAKAMRLLTLIDAQKGHQSWRQMAMLQGLAKAAQSIDEPIKLTQAPRLFTDKSLAGDDPLWQARIAARHTFTWPGDEMAGGKTPLTGEQTALLEKGKAFYRHCASCHGDKGQGITGLAPELAGSEWVTGPVEWLARIVLDGMQGEIVVGDKTWNGVMPGHRQFPGLDAETLTGLLIHLRRLGSNAAEAPSIEKITEIIEQPVRTTPWTAVEIQEVPYETSLDKFAGKYKISFVTMTITVENGKLMLDVPMQGSSPLKQIDDTLFEIEQGGDGMQFRFALNKQGEVEAMYLLRGGSENRVEKVK